MAVPSIAIDPLTNTMLHVERAWSRTHEVLGDEVMPVHLSAQAAHGTFKAVTFTSSGTTTIVSPKDTGALLITDIALFGDKVNSGSLELKFTDGTNEATLALATVTDAPVNFSQSFVGRFQGWADARVDLVVTQNVTGSATIGYVKVPDGLPFLQWDALR